MHFNEDELAEHNKDRGTRMKIDEPDTPFARSVSDSEAEESPSRPVTFFPAGSPSSSSSAYEEDSSPKSDPAEHKAFVEKRKAHYNEMKVARKLDSKKLTEEAFSESEL